MYYIDRPGVPESKDACAFHSLVYTTDMEVNKRGKSCLH